jgi:hypothetical protein
MNRLTSVLYSCSLDTTRSAVAVCESSVLLKVANTPEAGIRGRWGHLAEVTQPFNRLTRVCYVFFLAEVTQPFNRLTRVCYVLFRHFSSSSHRSPVISTFAVVKADWKRKSAVGGADQ